MGDNNNSTRNKLNFHWDKAVNIWAHIKDVVYPRFLLSGKRRKRNAVFLIKSDGNFLSTGTSFRKITTYKRKKNGSYQPRMVPPFFLYSSTIWEISRSSSASSSKPLNTSWKVPYHMISAKKKLLLELDRREPTQSVVLVAIILKTKIL